MEVPVLLITWRRPDTLRLVIDAIRPVAPTRLFVACDGPNPECPGEAEKVSATRAVIEHEIDWICEIKYFFSDVNQGCRIGVSRAITWFFDHVEEGIILEDDCVPHNDFLPYCEELLQLYRDDYRIWCISGTNHQNGISRTSDSYYFSQHMHCWGWATWKSRWAHYEIDYTSWPTIKETPMFKDTFDCDSEYYHWKDIWDQAAAGNTRTWCIKWYFTCYINGGLTAVPSRDLVLNVGFGADGTHTLGDHSQLSVDPTSFLPLEHPILIRAHRVADRYTTNCEYLKKDMHQRAVLGKSGYRLKIRTRIKNMLSKITR